MIDIRDPDVRRRARDEPGIEIAAIAACRNPALAIADERIAPLCACRAVRDMTEWRSSASPRSA